MRFSKLSLVLLVGLLLVASQSFFTVHERERALRFPTG